MYDDVALPALCDCRTDIIITKMLGVQLIVDFRT